jgi:undecaprenyl-diphosphatase
MTIISSILLGILQGITEFLPISSSAHLIAVPWLFKVYTTGTMDKLIYDVMVHFGTAFALLSVYTGRIYYLCRYDLLNMRRGYFRGSLSLKIALGTVPAVVLGLLFKNPIEYYLRTPYVCIFSLLAVSLLMLVAERIHAAKREITFAVALVIGVAQAVALIPGVSRSGITITMGILLGLKRDEAVDFAFLLSIPVVLGVAFFEARHVNLIEGMDSLVYLVGAFSAFISGLLSLTFLISYLKRHTLDVFAFYRVGLAILILAFIAFRI